MPRTKEAIAVVRGFCKHESKGTSGDAMFAKGILAAIRWMTEKDSPCPYVELEEDLDEQGGWKEEQLPHKTLENGAFTPTQVPRVAPAPAPITAPPVVAAVATTPIDDPYANIPRRDIDFGEVPQLLDAQGNPVVANVNTEGLGNNPKVLLPGSFEAALKEHTWLQPIADDLRSRHKGAPLNNSNTIIVGGGLEDGPVLAEDDYDDD